MKNEVLLRIRTILEVIQSREKTTRQISEITGIPIASTFRLVKLLKKVGWIRLESKPLINTSSVQHPRRTRTYLATIKITQVRE